MINNYFTLKHIVDYLNQHLKEAEIIEIYTQVKNEIIIDLTAMGNTYSLQVSIDPARNFMILRNQIKRQKINSVNLFEELNEKKILKFGIAPFDRVIDIYLEESLTFTITFFRGEGNIYFIDETGLIRDAFKNKKEVWGKELLIEKRNLDLTKFIRSGEELQECLRNVKEKNVLRSLNKVLPILGTIVNREILYRANIELDEQLSELSNIDISLIWQKFVEVYNDLKTPSPKIYFDKNRPLEFTLISMNHLEDNEYKQFEDINNAIIEFLFSRKKSKFDESEKTNVIKILENEIQYSESTIQKLGKELKFDRSTEYQKFGELLMSNLSEVPDGAVEFAAYDSSEKRYIPIPLDINLTPIQNATQYFEKSKKTKEVKSINERRLEDSKMKLENYNRILNEFVNVNDKTDFDSIYSKNIKDLEKLGIAKTEEKQKELTLFRRFIVEGEFEVLCGKNSDNNDLLTMKYAKPNDLWFHARGAGGSHVVLKVNSGKGEPSKKAIQQAAAIAAYYSQAKNSSMAPVVVAEKKYVRKPKGANSGTVTVQREKVIFVEPKLPVGSFQS